MKVQDPKISHEEVRRRYRYDPDTGKLTFRVAPPNQPASRVGKEAGYIRDTRYGKYRVVKFGNVAVYAHRIIWFYVTGNWPKGQIDHINGNKLDNRFDNFRVATQSNNKANGSIYSNNTSGYKGVVKCKNRWKAQLTHKNTVYYLGLYATKEEAHEAYVQKARELHGEFFCAQ